ncbi:hypothetical protein Dfri01_66440 [Dyadobacter frigoris]|nr:hypothetical protein Dfri01_66440 [Dyadobacter frigoris]
MNKLKEIPCQDGISMLKFNVYSTTMTFSIFFLSDFNQIKNNNIFGPAYLDEDRLGYVISC